MLLTHSHVWLRWKSEDHVLSHIPHKSKTSCYLFVITEIMKWCYKSCLNDATMMFGKSSMYTCTLADSMEWCYKWCLNSMLNDAGQILNVYKFTLATLWNDATNDAWMMLCWANPKCIPLQCRLYGKCYQRCLNNAGQTLNEYNSSMEHKSYIYI